MADHCQNLVSESDKDRYLATLFAPENKQPHLYALYAFDREIHRIRDVVSEAQMGEIRLQWWRDTIDGIFVGNPQEHPVAQALAATINTHHLPKEPFLNLIAAHQFDLYADKMPTLTDLEGYFGETSSVIMQMSCMILDPAATASEASGLLGVAYGIARIIGNFPRNSNILPDGKTVGDLVELGSRRWNEGRQASVSLPASVWPALLPCASVGTLLRKAASGKRAAISPLLLQWNIWRAARRQGF